MQANRFLKKILYIDVNHLLMVDAESKRRIRLWAQRAPATGQINREGPKN